MQTEFVDDKDVIDLPPVPLRPEPSVSSVNLNDLPVIHKRVSPVDIAMTSREAERWRLLKDNELRARLMASITKVLDEVFTELALYHNS